MVWFVLDDVLLADDEVELSASSDRLLDSLSGPSLLEPLDLRSLSLSEPFLFELFDPLSFTLLPLLVSEL